MIPWSLPGRMNSMFTLSSGSASTRIANGRHAATRCSSRCTRALHTTRIAVFTRLDSESLGRPYERILTQAPPSSHGFTVMLSRLYPGSRCARPGDHPVVVVLILSRLLNAHTMHVFSRL